MKPLATYYKLVDRDTEKVGSKWKVMSVLVLILAVVASAIVSFCFYSLEHAFGDRCIINADPLLKIREPVSSNETKNVLDVLNSKWGLNEDCNFAIFTPLFQSMTGIIWISLFLVCGNGGASNKNSVPKPYQIVLPVTLYLLAMIILTAYEVPFINDGLAAFCVNFLNQTDYLNEKTDGCGSLLDKYSQHKNQLDTSVVSATADDPSIIPISWHFYLTIAFIWTTLVAFLLGFILMIVRCLFVVDFELIKITIASQDEPEDTKELHREDDSMTNSSSASPTHILRNIKDSRLKPRRRGLKVDEHDAKKSKNNSSASDNSSLNKSDQIPLMSYTYEDEEMPTMTTERPRRPIKLINESKNI